MASNNWMQKIAAYEDTFELRNDGKLIFRGTQNECYRKLQQSQSQSFDWAMKYEGWTISQSGTDWRDSYQWYGGEDSGKSGAPVRCPECGFEDKWSSSDWAVRGGPVCPNCDIDMKVREF